MTATAPTAASSPHLLIGGPGRAGTSFLVRYLAELGLDTQLARRGEAEWYEDAKAGLEDLPLPGYIAHLPYVIKTPHLHQLLDAVLADDSVRVDGVIVPVRPLAEAAASRVVMELQSIHRTAPWMADLNETWEVWGNAPGGVVYSLNPLDQARLLAVGFYALVERAVRADIPLVLVAYPRMVTDEAYLFERLRPLLPATVTPEAARAAHVRIADPAAVRIGGERAGPATPPNATPVVRLDDRHAVDAIALRRELVALRRQIADLHGMLAQSDQRVTAAEAQAASLAAALHALRRSTAWRLTAPYRRAGELAKSWLRRLGGSAEPRRP